MAQKKNTPLNWEGIHDTVSNHYAEYRIERQREVGRGEESEKRQRKMPGSAKVVVKRVCGGVCGGGRYVARRYGIAKCVWERWRVKVCRRI